MTDRPQVPLHPPAPQESTGGEITGPALLRTTKPFPLADGRLKPVGSQFHAGPVAAKELLAQGVVEIVQIYGPPQPADGTEGDPGPEAQMEILDRLRQEIAKENEAEEVVRRTEARMAREHLADLEGFIQRFLTKYTDGSVAADDPDLDSRMFEWTDQLARDEIPHALRGRGLEHDSRKAADLQHYALLVSRLRWNLDRALDWVLPMGSLFAQLREDTVRTYELRVGGDEAAAKDHQRQVDLRKIEVARGYDESVPQLLAAVRLALSLLASMDPEHLISGARLRRHLQKEAEKDYRRAAIELFRQIIVGQEVQSLGELWRWVGTSYYRTAQVDGTRFTFKKESEELVISVTDEAGRTREVRRQKYVPSTLYEWRAAALKAQERSR